jgi:hypothetical protein
MLCLKALIRKLLVLTSFCAPQISFFDLQAYTESFFTWKVEIYWCNYRVSRKIIGIVLIVFNFGLWSCEAECNVCMRLICLFLSPIFSHTWLIYKRTNNVLLCHSTEEHGGGCCNTQKMVCESMKWSSFFCCQENWT